MLLVVNRGFADALRIGNQARPRLFDLAITLPSMLYEQVVEIDGRVGVDGEEIETLDEDAARRHLAACPRRRHQRLRHRADARLEIPGARAAPGRVGARGRLHPGLRQPRGQPAAAAGAARRHHGGGRLPVADPAPLRRSGGRRACRHAAVFHAVERRTGRGARLPGQGRDPVRAGRRHRRRGAHRGDGGSRPHHRLRHGRHLDRRRAVRRRVRARFRDRRWPACACARR